MTKLKTATQDFLKATKALVSTLVSEGKEKVTPIVDDIQAKIKQEKVKKEIKKNKVVDIKQDTSQRKYHGGRRKYHRGRRKYHRGG